MTLLSKDNPLGLELAISDFVPITKPKFDLKLMKETQVDSLYHVL